MRGSELLKQGKLDQAQRAFRAALEIDPDSARVLALLGLAHFRANEFSDARALYEQLVERAPTDASHRLNLGLVYLKLNDADRAIDALEASRALDPSQGRAVSYLGLAYARGGRYAEAYRAFLIAGQNDLAVEIESNLTAAERDRIHGQLGRTPHGPLPVAPRGNASSAALAAGAPGVPRTATPAPTPMGAPRTLTPTVPRTPTPTAPRTATPMAATRTPTPTGVPRTPTPTGVPRTPTPTGVPRTKPPSAPPGKRTPSQELPAAVPVPSPSPAVVGAPDIDDKVHIDAAVAAGTVALGAAASAPQEPGRVSDSMQFVLPRSEPAAPQEALDGPSMISRAVASATPTATIGPRTRTGGVPPRPLSELATDELLRPDDGDDAFEIAANGALIIRVTERVMTRLDGVHVTGGDLGYEPAMRRSRGHNTDEAFDYGGSQLCAVTGRGYLIAVPGEHAFSAVSLDDDILYLREDLVFAFQAQLRWENGNVPGLRGRLPVVQFRGNGALAMRLVRPLVRVKLATQGTLYVDADQLAGWVGRVIPRAVVPAPGGPLGAMCVECTGEGIVLIEQAPDDALEAPRVTAKWPRVPADPALASAHASAPFPRRPAPPTPPPAVAAPTPAAREAPARPARPDDTARTGGRDTAGPDDLERLDDL